VALWLVAALWLAACGAGVARPTPTTAPTTSGSAATPALLGSGSMSVTITAPADNSVVMVPQVIVTGLAPSETVLTINDSLLVVGVSGQFSVTVPLQEGPNELDVLASDPAGNQANTKLIVTYDPSE
jgi:hypothetical protein